MRVNTKDKKRVIFLKNFIGGLGWMAGATIGFALFISLFSLILKWLGGLPLIGNFIANIIDSVNEASQLKETIPGV